MKKRIKQFLTRMIVSGECNFVSSVLPQQRFEMMDQCYSSLLQLRVLFSEQRIVHHQDVRVGQPQRRGLNTSWLPLFICLISPPPHACPMQIRASQEGGMFVSPEVLTLVHGFFLCFLLAGFSLSLSVFQSLPFWTPFSIITT